MSAPGPPAVLFDTDMPDLSAGLCMPSRSPLPPRAWTGDGSAIETAAAIAECQRCPCLPDCRAWLMALSPLSRPSGIVAGRELYHKERRVLFRPAAPAAPPVPVSAPATVQPPATVTAACWYPGRCKPGACLRQHAPCDDDGQAAPALPPVHLAVVAGLAAAIGSAGGPAVKRNGRDLARKRAASAAYHLANREKILKRKAARWQEIRDARNAAKRAARAADPEPLRAYDRARHAANAAARNAAKRAARAADPEGTRQREREQYAARKARRREAG